MAAPTKVTTSVWAATAVAAGGSTQIQSSWIDVHTYYETIARLKVTWTGSLTTSPTYTVEASPDNGTTAYQVQQITGPTGASPWNPPGVSVDDTTAYVRLTLKNNDASVALAATANVDSISAIS